MPKASARTVHFSERVTVASLPIEEFKDSLNARRGPWGSAPVCDELWDGERRLFWERELDTDELRDILRFRKLAKYSLALQSTLGGGLVKIPMPRIPHIVEELVRLGQEEKARLQQQEQGTEDRKRAIAFPEEQPDSSPRHHSHPPSSSSSSSSTSQSVDDVFFQKTLNDDKEFSFENPSLHPSSSTTTTPAVPINPPSQRQHGSAGSAAAALFTPSQRESMRGAIKVIKPAAVLHRGRTKQRRMRRRADTHSILQPAFVLLYFFVPLLLLASYYLVPLVVQVYLAWRNQYTIRAVIDVPVSITNWLPKNSLFQSTVSVGLFVFEVSGILYVASLVLTQLMVFTVIRPLAISLSNSLVAGGDGMKT